MEHKLPTVFTIGFTQKSANQFFESLGKAGVQRVAGLASSFKSWPAITSDDDDIDVERVLEHLKRKKS